ncbi:hypothetical protein HZS_620 [Henneguya salminicola]|nr:hypothetical protein HZS_620 [Henneguya salminicola]
MKDLIAAIQVFFHSTIGRHLTVDFLHDYKSTIAIFRAHNITLRITHIKYLKGADTIAHKKVLDVSQVSKIFYNSNEKCDAKIVFIDMSNTTYYGQAFNRRVCSSQGIGIVNVGKKVSFNHTLVGMTLAHELSHIMGFGHYWNFIYGSYNQTKNCSCHDIDEKYCLMYPLAALIVKQNPPHLDDCSMKRLLPVLKSMDCLKFVKLEYSSIDVKQKCLCGTGDVCSVLIEENGTVNGIAYAKNTTNICSLDNCCDKCRFAIGHACSLGKTECGASAFCKDGILSVVFFYYI